MHASDSPEVTLVKNQDISFTLRGSAGLLGGEARELVYEPYAGTRRKASELIWDLKQIYVIGAVGSANLFDWVDVNLGIWTAATEGNGGMVDYDWFLNTPGAPSPDDWTDRSFSDVKVTTATMFDINAALKLFTWQNIKFKGIVGLKRDTWEWTDSGQGYVYSTRSFRDTVGSFDGRNVINYDQTFTIPYIGGSAAIPVGPVSISAYLLLSPSVSAEDNDFHVLRGIHFTEKFSGGTYVALGGNVSYHMTKNLFISGALDYQSIPEIAGDMTLRSATGEVQTAPDAAGISHNSLMISGSLGYTF